HGIRTPPATTSSPRPPAPRWGWWGGGWNVGAGHIHRAALGFQERDHRPDLLRGQLPRHHRHDRLVAGDDVGGGVVERLEQILLARLPRLAAPAPRADRSLAFLVCQQVRSAGAERVVRRAAAGAGVALL